jgi:hypothetical protein
MDSHGKWDDYDIIFMIIMTLKQRRLKCIEFMYKGDELYDVSTYCMKLLKYDQVLDIKLKLFATSN